MILNSEMRDIGQDVTVAYSQGKSARDRNQVPHKCFVVATEICPVPRWCRESCDQYCLTEFCLLAYNAVQPIESYMSEVRIFRNYRCDNLKSNAVFSEIMNP